MSTATVGSSIVIFLVVCGFPVCIAEEENKSAPYTVRLTHFSGCNVTAGSEIAYDIAKELQDGDRYCFTGNITLGREVDDELSSKIQVQKLGDDDWKEVMSFTLKKACSDTKKYEPNWFEFMHSLNINATDCPIPKGFYSFKCVSFDGKSLKSQATIKPGEYRITKTYWKKDVMVGCHYVEGIVTDA